MTRASVEQRLVLGVNDEATVDEVKKVSAHNILRQDGVGEGTALDLGCELKLCITYLIWHWTRA